MKVLITKSDGTPTKSKVHAYQFLEKKGLSKGCLIEENGQFFYESVSQSKGAFDEKDPQLLNSDVGQLSNPNDLERACEMPTGANDVKSAALSVSWETPVFDSNNEKTKLFIPDTDITATINAKHPAGQIKPKSSFELCIEGENVILSLDLVSKIFKVRG